MTDIVEWGTRADDGFGTVIAREDEATARARLIGTGGYWALVKRTVTPWEDAE